MFLLFIIVIMGYVIIIQYIYFIIASVLLQAVTGL